MRIEVILLLILIGIGISIFILKVINHKSEMKKVNSILDYYQKRIDEVITKDK